MNKSAILKINFFLLCFANGLLEAKEPVLFTEPKTGTHLLIPILKELTGKKLYWAKEDQESAPLLPHSTPLDLDNPAQIYFSVERHPWTAEDFLQVWENCKERNSILHLHAPYSIYLERFLSEKQTVNFFVKRDPRDQLVSLFNHFVHIDAQDEYFSQLQSTDERLMYLIRNGLRKKLLAYMGWLNSPCCCVLEFHKLMGAHGGQATDSDALSQMRKISDALELSLSDQQLFQIYRRSFGKGWSFFQGKVGSWKDYLNEEHKAAVKEEIGDLLIELGFESDLNW